MLKRKFKYFLTGLLLGNSIVVFGVDSDIESKDRSLNYELKIGITPYKNYGSNSSSERFDSGVDFGIEVYKQFNKYSLGFGGEVKRKVEEEYIDGDSGRLYTYYVLGDKKIGRGYSVVGRIGRTSQREFYSKFYGAVGIGKNIGNLNIQLLGETTKLENRANDKEYSSIGLKIGYVFGGALERTKVIPPILEENETVVTQPLFEPLIINGEELTGGYDAYKTDVSQMQKIKIKDFVSILNGYENNGILEMKAFSDNTGNENLNIKLANERMDNLEYELKNNNLRENIEIIKIDPKITIKKEYKVENDTFEKRKINRRIEVNYVEK